MKKWVKFGFPITCVVVVGGTLIAVGNLKSKADEIHNRRLENSISYNVSINTNTENRVGKTENSVKNENTIDNKVNNTIANTNSIANNTVEANNNTVAKNTSILDNPLAANTEETDKDYERKDDKERALELVQAEWGEDSSVYYTNEKEDNGLFIVAVRDKSNTAAKAFYKVDLKNNTVELDW